MSSWSALGGEPPICKFIQVINGNKESNGTYSHVNSSGETVEDVRTDDITAKVISQSAHPRNQLQIKTEKEIKVY